MAGSSSHRNSHITLVEYLRLASELVMKRLRFLFVFLMLSHETAQAGEVEGRAGFCAIDEPYEVRVLRFPSVSFRLAAACVGSQGQGLLRPNPPN